MKHKTTRLIAIKNIINSKKITCQEELLHELERQKFDLTQATLSRDLKFLRASKIVDSEKGYIYRIPENGLPEQPVKSNPSISGFKSIDFSNHLAVMKTLPGFASSIAFKIDNSNMYEILGTIAGDDTLLIIPRENVTKSAVINALSLIISEINKHNK